FAAHRTDREYFFRTGIVTVVWRGQEERDTSDRSHEPVTRAGHGKTRSHHPRQPRSLTAHSDDHDCAGRGNVAINNFERPGLGYQSLNRCVGSWRAVALPIAYAVGCSCLLFTVRRFG